MYKGEKLNGITHLLGAIAALAGTVVLVVLASMQGDPWKIVSFSLYGATLFVLYLFSTLYHSLRGRAKQFFQKLDHIAIYLLIAGTYTPFTLVTLRGTLGWSLFGVIWGLAAVGIVLDVIPKKNANKGPRILAVIIYIIMGWLVLIALDPLMDNLTDMGMTLLAAGGLFYTIGIVFYALGGKMSHAHGIWHLFVLAGSVSHYFTILLYVA
ncbi:MAG: hemolysin III family protein [Gammaproteobacteria bacterium]|nr:hemolysin III family protein [Gammaproteobacteria bacterium]